jgi:hypothetical protein
VYELLAFFCFFTGTTFAALAFAVAVAAVAVAFFIRRSTPFAILKES